MVSDVTWWIGGWANEYIERDMRFSHFRWHWGVQNRGYGIKMKERFSISMIIGQITHYHQSNTWKPYSDVWFLKCQIYQFHTIPWNCTEYFYEKKNQANSTKLGSRENAPWKSLELWIWITFHGIPWNISWCCSNSVEFHGITKSSMELRGVVLCFFYQYKFILMSWKEIFNNTFDI